MDLSIVIPCYNEVENVPRLREQLLPVAAGLARGRTVELVLVDDGSVDGTGPALRAAFGRDVPGELSVCFQDHGVNRGLGAALRTGLAASSGAVVVTTDSDGTYHFGEIPDLLACLVPGVDLVTASPYHPQGGVAGVPGYRLFLSRGSSAIYRLLVSRRVHTYTSLFRAYRREVIERVPFESDGFLAGTELLVRAMLLGYRVGEYPTVLNSRAAGVSKARLARTIRAHLAFQARILLFRAGKALP